MGQSTDGILALGWNLGGTDDEVEWAADLVHRLAEDDADDVILEAIGAELPPDPWEEITDKPNSWFYEGGKDSAEYAAWKERTDAARQARYNVRRAALDAVSFQLVSHCSHEYPMWLLTLRDLNWSASRGYPVDVSEVLTKLATPLHYQVAADTLRTAAAFLGLDPPDPPRLFLASDWS